MAEDLARLRVTAQDDTKGAFASLQNNMQQTTGAFDRLKSSIAGLGVGIIVGMFTSAIKGAIDTMDRINDLNKVTSIAHDQLAGLSFAAKQSGGDLEGIAQSIAKMSVSMGKESDKFRELGITAKEPLQAFKQLADVFSQIEDPALRNAVAAGALGKSWQGAAPLLAEGSAKIQEMVDKGARLTKITAEQARAADELNDKWIELTGTGGVLNAMVGAMLPNLLRLTNQLIELKSQSVGDVLLGAFGLSGKDGKNPGAAIEEVNTKLATMRGTLADFERMSKPGGLGPIYKVLNSEDTALLSAQIALMEKRKSLLMALPNPNIAEQNAQNSRELSRLPGSALSAAEAAAKGQAFLKEPKSGAAAKDSGFDSLLEGLRKKLALDKESSELEKLNLDLLSKKHALIAPAQAAELRQIAEKIDIKQREIDQLERMVKYEDEIAKLEEQKTERMTSFLMTWSEYRQNLEFETQVLGLTETQLRTRTALRKLDADYQKSIVGLSGEQLQTVIEINNKNKELLPELIAQNAARSEAVEKQKKLEEETKRMNDDIGRSLTDALLRGFESGKDFAKNFRDTLENMFKTLVLRPLIQPIATGLAATLTGALGFGGVANAAGGDFGGLGNLLSLGKSAYDFSTGGGLLNSLGNAFGIGGGGASAGLLSATEFGVIGELAGVAAAEAAAGAAAASATGLASLGVLGPLGLAAGAALLLGGVFGGGGGTPATFDRVEARGTASAGGFNGNWTTFANPGYQAPMQNHVDPLFNALIASAFTAMESMARMIGADPARVSNASVPFNFNVIEHADPRGPNAGEILRAAQGALGQVTDQIARDLVPGIDDLRKASESLTQTFARLAAAERQAQFQKITSTVSGALALGDSVAALRLSDLSPLTNAQRLDVAYQAYQTAVPKAWGGDQKAFATLQTAAPQFLTEMRNYYGSSQPYTDAFASVQEAIGGLVDNTLNEQAIAFAAMQLTLSEIAANTNGLDERFLARLQPAIDAANYADHLARVAQAAAAEMIAAATREAAAITQNAVNVSTQALVYAIEADTHGD